MGRGLREPFSRYVCLCNLARDRFGIKPLYYQAGDKFFRFASFLPSLLKMPDVDKTIDPAALQHFLSFRAIVGTHSLFNGIRKLPPATTMTITPDGQRSQKIYWQNNYLRTQDDEDRSEEEWIDLVHEGLLKAVERRLVADVPVGVLLSGGLDSSLLLTLAARAAHRPEEMSGGQRQRVAIARALVGKPPLLLADEPTGNLDSRAADDIMALFLTLNRQLGITILIVTHDPTIAARCPRRIVMRDGQVLDDNRGALRDVECPS